MRGSLPGFDIGSWDREAQILRLFFFDHLLRRGGENLCVVLPYPIAWRLRSYHFYDRILSRGSSNLCILLPYPMAWRLRSYRFYHHILSRASEKLCVLQPHPISWRLRSCASVLSYPEACMLRSYHFAIESEAMEQQAVDRFTVLNCAHQFV